MPNKYLSIFSVVFVISYTVYGISLVHSQASGQFVITKAEVITNSGQDKVGMDTFKYGGADGYSEDLAWDISFNTGNKNVTIKAIRIASPEGGRYRKQIWSNIIKMQTPPYYRSYDKPFETPLLVYLKDGQNNYKQINFKNGDTLGKYGKNKEISFRMYGQPLTPDAVSWSKEGANNLVIIDFEDKTSISAKIVPSNASATGLGPKPIITKADLLDINVDKVNTRFADQGYSKMGPKDLVWDVSLDMNGSIKTISYVSVIDDNTGWSTAPQQNFFDKEIVPLFRISNGQVVSKWEEFSGRDVNFRLYGQPLQDMSGKVIKLSIVFTDGTVVSKEVNKIQSPAVSISAPVILEAKQSMYLTDFFPGSVATNWPKGTPNDVDWDVSIDMKGYTKTIRYFYVSSNIPPFSFYTWTTLLDRPNYSNLYPRLVVVLYNGKKLNSEFGQKFGPYSGGVHKFKLYGNAWNVEGRTDHGNGDTLHVVFTDGTIISAPITRDTPPPVVKDDLPIITKAETIVDNQLDMAGAKDRFYAGARYDQKNDWEWDVSLNMNGTTKTIRHFIISNKDKNQDWSTDNRNGSYPLVVYQDNKRLNDKYGHKFGPYSGTNIEFKMYGQQYRPYIKGFDGQQSFHDSDAYHDLTVIFTDGSSINAPMTIAEYPSSSLVNPIKMSARLVSRTEDFAGKEGVFGPGSFEGVAEDWGWELKIESVGKKRTVGAIRIRQTLGRYWSTDNPNFFPLVMRNDGKTLNKSYVNSPNKYNYSNSYEDEGIAGPFADGYFDNKYFSKFKTILTLEKDVPYTISLYGQKGDMGDVNERDFKDGIIEVLFNDGTVNQYRMISGDGVVSNNSNPFITVYEPDIKVKLGQDVPILVGLLPPTVSIPVRVSIYKFKNDGKAGDLIFTRSNIAVSNLQPVYLDSTGILPGRYLIKVCQDNIAVDNCGMSSYPFTIEQGTEKSVIVSANLVGSESDKAGTFGVFGPGEHNKISNDWTWEVVLDTKDQTKTISKIEIIPSISHRWGSSKGEGTLPLVVFRDGKQLNTTYDQVLGIYKPTSVVRLILYGQRLDNSDWSYVNPIVKITFTDGTTLISAVTNDLSKNNDNNNAPALDPVTVLPPTTDDDQESEILVNENIIDPDPKITNPNKRINPFVIIKNFVVGVTNSVSSLVRPKTVVTPSPSPTRSVTPTVKPMSSSTVTPSPSGTSPRALVTPSPSPRITPRPSIIPTPIATISTPTPAPTPFYPPMVTVVFPNGGETWLIGSRQNITWSYINWNSGIFGNKYVDMYLVPMDGRSPIKLATNFNSPNGTVPVTIYERTSDGGNAWLLGRYKIRVVCNTNNVAPFNSCMDESDGYITVIATTPTPRPSSTPTPSPTPTPVPTQTPIPTSTPTPTPTPTPTLTPTPIPTSTPTPSPSSTPTPTPVPTQTPMLTPSPSPTPTGSPVASVKSNKFYQYPLVSGMFKEHMLASSATAMGTLLKLIFPLAY